MLTRIKRGPYLPWRARAADQRMREYMPTRGNDAFDAWRNCNWESVSAGAADSEAVAALILDLEHRAKWWRQPRVERVSVDNVTAEDFARELDRAVAAIRNAGAAMLDSVEKLRRCSRRCMELGQCEAVMHGRHAECASGAKTCGGGQS
jgi:hypothetical protein